VSAEEKPFFRVKRLVKGATDTNTINLYNELAVKPDFEGEDVPRTKVKLAIESNQPAARASLVAHEEPMRCESKLDAQPTSSRVVAISPSPLPAPHVGTVSFAPPPIPQFATSAAFEYEPTIDPSPARCVAELEIESEPAGRVRPSLSIESKIPVFQAALIRDLDPPKCKASVQIEQVESSCKATLHGAMETPRLTAANSNVPPTARVVVESVAPPPLARGGVLYVPKAYEKVVDLSPDLDAVEMAQAMREAARMGVPFCEECTRARLRSAAKKPEPKPSLEQQLIAEASVDALVKAAHAGVPFCEECAKAAAKKAAAH
jgi:hypothetical protein